MGPIRTGDKSDAEDGEELVRAPLNAKLGFQAQKWAESSEAVSREEEDCTWGLKRDCPAGSKTSWSGEQVRLKLDRADRRDCSLKAKIPHTAFPAPSMATSSRLPYPEDIPEDSSLLSCVCIWPPSDCPGHSPLPLPPATPTQTPGLSIKVTSPQEASPRLGPRCLLRSPVQPCADFNHLSNSLDPLCVPSQSPEQEDTCFQTVHHNWAQPQLLPRTETGRRGSRCPRFSPCLLSLFCPSFATSPSPDHTAYKNSSRKNCSDSHQDGIAPRSQEKVWKPGQLPMGSVPVVTDENATQRPNLKDTCPPHAMSL